MSKEMTTMTFECTFCGSVETKPFPSIIHQKPIIKTSCCDKCSIFENLKVGVRVQANALERDPAQLEMNKRRLNNGLEDNPIYTVSQIRRYHHFTQVCLRERNKFETFNAVIFTPLGFTKEEE